MQQSKKFTVVQAHKMFVVFSAFTFICLVLIGEFLVRKTTPQELSSNMREEHPIYGYLLNCAKGKKRHEQSSIIQYYNYHFYHLRDTQYKPNANNILVLGDSFTFGLLLPWKETYVAKLQNKLDKKYGVGRYNMLLAATGGWGAGEYLSYLEDFISKINPRYVLVFINTDDIGRAIRENLYALKQKDSLELDRLPPKQRKITIGRFMLKFDMLKRYSALFNLLIRQAINFKNRNLDLNDSKYRQNSITDVIWHKKVKTPCCSGTISFTDEYCIAYGKAIFLRMLNLCKQNDTELLVTTTGYNAFWPDDLRDATKIFMQTAEQFFNAHNIPFFDTGPELKSRTNDGDGVALKTDHHPSEYGATQIADICWPWLNKTLDKFSCSSRLN